VEEMFFQSSRKET